MQTLATKTIAVLPFKNNSNQQDFEYLCDGMTEEIIHALAKIGNLRVTSRTSSFYFKDKDMPVQEIGNALHVSTILEGSIQFVKDKMRIKAQLIDVVDDYQFWSTSFNRSIEDIFAVQEEISLLIAEKLREHVGHFDIEGKLTKQADITVDLYKKYLKGRYHVLKMGQADVEKGMALFKDIIDEAPGFALAYFGMNLGYTLLGTIGLLPAAESFRQGKYFLDKGIELGPELPESQLQLSYYAFLQDWDLDKTYKHINKSFELRPTVEFYQSMTSVLVCEGKFEAARNYINTAIQLDPFSSINYHLQGFTYYCEEQYAQAVECFQKSMEIKPDNEVSLLYLGQALILKGHTKAGRVYFENIQPQEGDSAGLIKTAGLAMAYTKLGNLTLANENIFLLEAAVETDQAGRAINLLAQCTCLQEDYKTAMFWLEKGFEMRLPLMMYTFVEPMLKPLHQLERFQTLKEQILKVETSFVLPIKKYKKPLFTQADVEKYKKQVTLLLEKERPYLDPNLSLKDLAEMLVLPPNYMSQLLNAGFDQNFSEFVNSYRLEAFKRKIADPQMRHLTILALAYESGFNSKTVFNNFFKKMMGQTPKAYWKSVTKND